MNIVGSRNPNKVEILKTENNISVIALRRNIIEKTESDKLTGGIITTYSYEEVKIKVKNRPTLIQDIMLDFNSWFDVGLTQEAVELDLKEKKKKMKSLMSKYEQLDINSELLAKNMLLEEKNSELIKRIIALTINSL